MSNLITCSDWTDGDDYMFAYAETSDPRVLAFIRTDEHTTFQEELDGDAIFPTFIIDRDDVSHTGGYEGDSESIAKRIVEARAKFRYVAGYRYNGLSYEMIAKADAMTARYARIFHATVFVRATHGYQGAYDMLSLSTPEFREHVGDPAGGPSLDAEQAQLIAHDSELANIADGYVYGIGWAVNEERLSHDEPVEFFEFTENVESWGYVGEEYAKRSAASFDSGAPELDPIPETLDIVTAALKAV